MRAPRKDVTLWPAILLIALSAAGGGKESMSPTPGGKNPVVGAAEGQRTIAPASKTADSGLVLSPGSFGGSRLYRSWPLILRVTAWRKHPAKPETAAPRITIKAKNGAWSDALVIAVKNAADETVSWPWHPVRQDASTLSLDMDGTATVAWSLRPEETSSLAEGDYVITAAFDPSKIEMIPPDAGAVQGDAYHLQVVKEPADLDPDRQEEKIFIAAWLNITQGDTAGVEEKAAQMLAVNPESIGGRRLRAALLAREGKMREALGLLDEALSIYDRRFPGADPPGGLMEERSEILKTIKPAKLKKDRATKGVETREKP